MAAHQFREDGSHYNGGKEFFGYGYKAIGEPRLRMIRRWYRQGARRGQTEDRFFADGQLCDGYEAAVEAIKSPPVLTESEAAALALVTNEWADLRFGGITADLSMLGRKGMIEWQAGKCRLAQVAPPAAAMTAPCPTAPQPDHGQLQPPSNPKDRRP